LIWYLDGASGLSKLCRRDVFQGSWRGKVAGKPEVSQGANLSTGQK